ncbi:hypothetical protein VB834_02670 [Limnoraphis robusta Tam1]|jgi:hypothetical protein|uniref:CopG-like ribbon-helix-helix domain-containing protein n=1 Tax=Limnoraphis robusta CCNP1315 TaxID=3110306 RepID=A0ABU5U2F1_9CYAN|nr:hypothetical protein [Limnoraphis robusta]MCG5059375.1 hypothetical protein [Limnoraphis sp. WC205]MEA5500044.1 hypothetical protein [Limnoraphis robusta BA-68 BA1]MEA5521190.1 hypothetical protein [Limnoraphis robusta CCNP1315]MEA5537929.1 hypothetical protein [Limnoraphis robusta Tam1]MEA5546660.1 hypothetical protein [Limnoraphis robusta CCNP1324]
MAKTFTITLPDELEQALMVQAERLNQSLEEVVLQVLSQQIDTLSQSQLTQPEENDPLLRLIGSLHVDVSDLAENHDQYLGNAFYQELKGVE